MDIQGYTLLQKLSHPTLKSFSDEIIAEKIIRFCVLHNESMGIRANNNNNKN